MIRIKYIQNHEEIILTAEEGKPNFLRRLFGEAETVDNVDGWVAGDAARCDALGALRMYGEEHPSEIRIEDNRLVVSHAAVAALSASQARALGLPARPPFVFSADTSGIIGSSDFKLSTCWLDGGRPITAHRCGAFLETGQGEFLIPEPIYSTIELSEHFNAGEADLPEHWSALSRFRHLLDSEASGEPSPVEMSRFLQGLRIYTGAALSLALDETDGKIDFEPMLFDMATSETAADAGRPLTERDGMLPANLLDEFQKHPDRGFRAFDTAKCSYLLGENTYLIVDEDVEIALQVVREKQRASLEERRAFATNPRAAIIERMIQEAPEEIFAGNQETVAAAEEEIEIRAASLFVETPEYADRAIRIGLWEKPELDFLPYVPNVWLPETFALNLGGVWVELDKDAVKILREKISQAIETSQSEIEYQGQRIPATEEVHQILAGAIGTEAPISAKEEQKELDVSGEEGEDESKPTKTVVIVHQNYVVENWRPKIPPRKIFVHSGQPSKVKTRLLKHQEKSFGWQVEAWAAGLPGVLNADDQGLGKTLQTLAFLAWLQTNMAEGPVEKRKPILVVAPKGLLRTWEHEAKAHLKGTGLGAQIRAYGADLKNLCKLGLPGRDTDDGVPRLDFGDLKSSISQGKGHQWWLLTTYETLANYQHSFRQIDFSTAVFDEIQKIKNVRTLVSLAARGLKADFRVGLTGTPIENHVSDLWAIMDAIAPGRLSTMKEFLERYQIVTEDGMNELHSRLFKEVRSNGECYPPVAQRRFKESEIDGLPRKDYRVYSFTMPDNQAIAYETARQHLIDGGRGAALKLLHHIRSVSLHPEPPEMARGDMETYFVRSARFLAMRSILKRIHNDQERALIFTEDRRMQAFVAQWVRSEFGLSDVPIINGATSIARRQQYVDSFQKHVENNRGFDVMILSPRAAGVGLTLTAATHVVHLSRWWNPAVEEQCNDRIYRIGQKSDVMVHLPFAIHPTYREQSFDCVLNDLMRRKTSLARAALWPPTNNDFDVGMLMAGINNVEPINLSDIDGLDWAGFEDWIIERARESGDWMVSDTPHSGDGGADAVLRHCRRHGTTALVQAKYTADRTRLIDDAAVREVIHAATRYDVENPQLVVITNACGFTRVAQEVALENGVTLLDRNRLTLWPSHALG